MLTEKDAEKVRELKDKGFTVSKIAREMGVDRKTVRKYLDEDNHIETAQFTKHSGRTTHTDRVSPKFRGNPFIQKEVIPVSHPSEKVVDEREDTEVAELQVRKQKAMTELEKMIPQKEHPLVVERKARFEAKKLDLDEFKVDRELQVLREEERRKARAEEEAMIQQEMERQRLADEEEREQAQLAEEQRRLAEREKWIQEYQDRALTWWLPWGVSIPTTLKFQIKDEIKKALENRSESEDSWEIERLVKEVLNATIQPFLHEQEAKNKAEEVQRKEARKVQLIQSWVLPEVEKYIRAQGLEAYVNEESRGKIKEYVRNHFMKTLAGDEAGIFSFEVTNLLDNFLKPVKEEIKKMKQEERQEMERKEKEDKEAQKKARMENLLQIGMNRLNHYLLANRKELGLIDAKEREGARKYLEEGLRKETQGNESRQEVEKLADEILNDFFFEE